MHQTYTEITTFCHLRNPEIGMFLCPCNLDNTLVFESADIGKNTLGIGAGK